MNSLFQVLLLVPDNLVDTRCLYPIDISHKPIIFLNVVIETGQIANNLHKSETNPVLYQANMMNLKVATHDSKESRPTESMLSSIYLIPIE